MARPSCWRTFANTACLYRTFDHGDSAPTACAWWAVDRNANVFCFREYYQANALISTHRANIAALSKQERHEQNLADSSIFHQQPMQQGGRWSVAEYAEVQAQLFARAGDGATVDNLCGITQVLPTDRSRRIRKGIREQRCGHNRRR
jgi:hypothetical protein